MNRLLCARALFVMTGFLAACGGEAEQAADMSTSEDVGDAANTPDLGFDASADSDMASNFDVGSTPESSGTPRPPCESDDLPEIVSVTLLPESFASQDLSSATATVTVEVACFSGPITTLSIVTDEERRSATLESLEDKDGVVTATIPDVGSWLDGLPPAEYDLVVTARSETETLTETGLVTVQLTE